MQCETREHASGTARVGLCSKFRKKWDSLGSSKDREHFLRSLDIDEDYFDIHERFVFHVKARMDFIDFDTTLKDPVVVDGVKDVAVLFIDVRYDACHPSFKDLDSEDVIQSVFYEWLFHNLVPYVCSLRQMKPYSLGLVVSQMPRLKE